MTAVQKIDSNQTGLRYAEEASIGVLPGSPVWYPLEPNSYPDFGGDVKTVARNPINQSRQRQRGVVVDVDANGGLEDDFTQINFQRLSQGYFFADMREKFDTEPMNSTALTDVSVDGTGNGYDAAAFGMLAGAQRRVHVGSLILASGFGTAANNGLKVVSVITADTSIDVTDTGLVTEAAAADQRVRVVGHQFGSAALNVNATPGDLPRIEYVGSLVAASGTLTLTENAADGNTVTIGDRVYTFETGALDTANKVLVGATASDSLDNLIAAINGAVGVGTTYATGTVANDDVSAVAGGGDTMVVTCLKKGTLGNLIATTDTLAGSSAWGAATLASGAGQAFDTFGLIPGEWIYIGGDTAPTTFVTAANTGWARIKEIEDDALVLDKTSFTMVDETGTGLTIQLFWGRVIKNESDESLIVRRTYQFERTLGAPDDSDLSEIQSEYLVGSVPNEMKINFKTADKITKSLSFVSTDSERRSGATGVKSGSRPDLVASDAYNTTSHFGRLKMSILDPVDSNPTALFGFVMEFSVGINNNVTPNKAIGTTGAFDMSAGNFNVDGTAQVYFSDVAAVDAIRNNSDVTFDFALVKDNSGLVMDVPLIALGDGRLKVEQDKPITLPVTMPAAADLTFDHTLLMCFFDYLPNAAE